MTDPHRLIPGGSHTYAKGDDQFPEWFRALIVRGKGCYIWDTDGNQYTEYGMGLRSVTLGHACPAVNAAVIRELANGVNFGRPARIELEAAERFCAHIPTAEMVKFGKNGSDATTGGILLARAYTGRDKVAICGDQPFFSVHEWFMGTTAIHAGIPQTIRDLTLKFRYNDLASIESLFAEYPDQIACLVLEAERETPPLPGFLQGVIDLAHRNGALVLFDEIVTGFRFHPAGAHIEHGVVPDLSAYGKGMGNGLSISALTGKREIMRLGGLDHVDKPRVFLMSTTYGAESHHLAGAMAVMDIYQRNDVCGYLDRIGGYLRQQAQAVIDAYGLTNHIPLIGRNCCLFFGSRDQEGQPSQAFRTLFLQEMLRRGFVTPSLIVSYSHSYEDVDRTIEAIDATCRIYARALEGGVEGYLYGRPVQSVYRYFNSAPVVAPTPT